jgi:hypothetical protein
MTPDQRDWVIAFASASAICEIWGTITVWISYRRSAKVGDAIKTMFTQFEIDQRNRTLIDQIPQWSSNSEFVNAMKRTMSTFSDISDTLTKKWWMTAGFWAYVFGALFGVAAVIAGVS